jgi:hypothetical protein
MSLLEQSIVLIKDGWRSPSKTLDNSTFNKPSYVLTILLPVLYSLTPAVVSARDFQLLLGSETNLFLFMIPTIFIGIVSYRVLIPGILYYVGRIWKGESSFQKMRLAVIFSSLPSLILLPIEIYELFSQESVFNKTLTLWSYIVQLYSFGLLIAYIKKVQNFNLQFAILNFILPVIGFGMIYILLNLLLY